MARSLSDTVYDQALNYIKNNCDKMILCSAQPTTYAEAVTTYALADVTMTSSDYTVSNGDVSGRKVRAAAKTSVTVDAGGTGTHIAHVKTGDTTLHVVTTCTSQAVTAGGTVDFPVHDIEFEDPVAP